MAATERRSDAQLLADIRELFAAVDPVPPRLAEEAKFAISLAAMDAELARLVESGPLPVRDGAPAGTTATFAGAAMTVMIATTPEPDGSVRVDGWLTPAGGTIRAYADPDPLRLAGTAPAGQAHADATGRFALPALAAGMHLFVIRPDAAGSRTVVTPVIEL